ncbi:MAG: hypothetical protein SGPRY_009844 [Prymnesium sp.]
MSFLQAELFNQTQDTRHTGIEWPQDATFTVGRANIQAQPFWLYEALHRLTTLESSCLHSGSIQWAHSLERLWFEIFDPRVPKIPRYFFQPGTTGECLFGPATASRVQLMRRSRLRLRR